MGDDKKCSHFLTTTKNAVIFFTISIASLPLASVSCSQKGTYWLDDEVEMTIQGTSLNGGQISFRRRWSGRSAERAALLFFSVEQEQIRR